MGLSQRMGSGFFSGGIFSKIGGVIPLPPPLRTSGGRRVRSWGTSASGMETTPSAPPVGPSLRVRTRARRCDRNNDPVLPRRGGGGDDLLPRMARTLLHTLADPATPLPARPGPFTLLPFSIAAMA